MPVEKEKEKKNLNSHLTFLSTQVPLKLNLLIEYFKQLHGTVLATDLEGTTVVESDTLLPSTYPEVRRARADL